MDPKTEALRLALEAVENVYNARTGRSEDLIRGELQQLVDEFKIRYRDAVDGLLGDKSIQWIFYHNVHEDGNEYYSRYTGGMKPEPKTGWTSTEVDEEHYLANRSKMHYAYYKVIRRSNDQFIKVDKRKIVDPPFTDTRYIFQQITKEEYDELIED